MHPSPCGKTGFTALTQQYWLEQAKPEHANTQLGRQEWFSIDSAGNRPRPMSVLLSFAAPTPCALVLMHAASSCRVSIALLFLLRGGRMRDALVGAHAAAEYCRRLTRHMGSTMSYLGKHPCSCQETDSLHYKP